jgi:hypothetical protein
VVGLCELDGAREQALYVGLSRWGSRGRPQEVVLRERVMVDPPLCPEPRPEPLCDPRDSLDS